MKPAVLPTAQFNGVQELLSLLNLHIDVFITLQEFSDMAGAVETLPNWFGVIQAFIPIPPLRFCEFLQIFKNKSILCLKQSDFFFPSACNY